ncbi:DUF6355 family natural product biosynthesis protein [Allokutzneria sp. NRRL B-24872]|uniref:DUF6355 family natural product biosynthesis protein n=1 Tax=Allokutzneria sp. NRRL B-24872 TaxID=1137961 RepID=UPI000A36395A|nr:DUF6355 family natural product biosynthesis protein [Allokutzneria sp. NRRL B-24872]
MRRTARTVVGTLALMAAAISLTAVPAGADEVVAAAKCGFHKEGTPAVQAWYNHCGSGNVWIRKTYAVGSDEFECVRPGDTLLGVWPYITGAYYDNRTC